MIGICFENGTFFMPLTVACFFLPNFRYLYKSSQFSVFNSIFFHIVHIFLSTFSFVIIIFHHLLCLNFYLFIFIDVLLNSFTLSLPLSVLSVWCTKRSVTSIANFRFHHVYYLNAICVCFFLLRNSYILLLVSIHLLFFFLIWFDCVVRSRVIIKNERNNTNDHFSWGIWNT